MKFEVFAACPAKTEHEVASRIREVYDAIVAASSGGEKREPKVPAWFLERIGKVARQGDEPWDIDAWMYWLVEEDREWDIVAIHEQPGRLVIDVQTVGWPLAHGSFDVMVLAAGATDVDWDDYG
jgi:hypothetical protein